MNPTERYLSAHERMIKTGAPVPHRLLRNHLDFQRRTMRNRRGLHPVTITISESTSAEIIAWFPSVRDLEISPIVRVAGQPFGPNRV